MDRERKIEAVSAPKLMCACNKRKCDGICRANHVNEKKEVVCPAVFVEREERRFRREEEE